MHSSRMRTGRTLTVFRWRPPPKNWRTPPKNWRTPPRPDPPRKIGEPPENWRTPPDQTPPVDRMTHACENITLAKTSFQPVTRLHSSRMHTARSLTVSPSMLCSGGGCLLRGVPGPRGEGGPGSGGCLVPGEGLYPSMHWGRPPLWTDKQV